MIRAAGLGVAYRAKPIVAAEARASIVHGDHTALLNLQGYRRYEFAEWALPALHLSSPANTAAIDAFRRG